MRWRGKRLDANTESRFSKSSHDSTTEALFWCRRVDLIENFNFCPAEPAIAIHIVSYLCFRAKWNIEFVIARALKFIIRGNALPPDSGWSSKRRTVRKSFFCDFMIVMSRSELCIPINRNNESYVLVMYQILYLGEKLYTVYVVNSDLYYISAGQI